MHPDKAPGPYGLNTAFFQSFWPIMDKDIYTSCSSWLEKKKFLAKE